ncbi:S-DNA-T family DNA segregation ATPase FtsK/SpoIIIE [Microbacterium sp. W4I4]|uniref:FtsK/SpoIIIE domain-containing protein n=1 Tax=Microbacterium sp. W4I4 TaxID=3042295 RepID=UPI002782F41D|nr:FtsK/SpoIIIE domain-containing protein [Microbacterium sp. W4I4]MDQ0613181.1 S-DNA-T family DNA segregation ATPase FtsK/SpoIIIE [Microbacterium sp. W4I4]
MDATTIVLPAAPADARRPSLPLLAAVVPVIAGVVLWVVTGSLFALCFAALGPLMLVASFLDGLRTRGRERRRAEVESDAAWQRAERELEQLHAQELATLRRREPDVAECLREQPLRGHAPVGHDTAVVLGRGARVSRVQARGGEDERSRAFRARTQRLEDAPVSVPLGGGICIRAPRPVAQAVARALVAQLCLRFGSGQLAVCGDAAPEWALEAFPHVGRRRAGFRLRVGDGDEPVDAEICIRMPGEEAPEGITTIVDCTVPHRARARTPDGDTAVSVEAISARQARAIGARLTARTDDEGSIPDRIGLDELTPAASVGLLAAFGRGERGDLSVDLVEDGPHAIVTGMTGTGKSELLTSWVAALAAVHAPEDVAFVLVDFKGGTAFDPLRRLPHVVAVVTDLDAEGARRGVGSLTAELRRREAALAAAGVRDVGECTSLGRLVIVVDEFAALLQEHPELGEIFTDVAARGRALGMHLVLGTQRASGSIREALAANCPLRISLRVAETADSRFVIGSDAAAQLRGGVESRGLAFVRRPHDGEALAVRIALTDEADLLAIAQRWEGHAAQSSPWLPPLPARLPLPSADRRESVVLLGLADEPLRQRQPRVGLASGERLAVIGGPGSGKSSALRMIASQLPDAVLVPADPEKAWDAVAELAGGSHGPVLCDDLDVLVGQYPADYAQLFLTRWESIVRDPAGTVIALSRVSGPLGRLVDALPRRALLRLTSKVEHIAAGGEPAAFDRNRPAGRAWLDDRETQLFQPDDGSRSTPATVEPDPWEPSRRVVGIITPSVDATRAALAGARTTHRIVTLEQGGPSDGDGGVIIIGDPEQWRAQWARLQTVRTAGELVVAAECASELRQLAGVRELPPYARQHEDRAWSVEAGGRPRRVLLA